MSASTSLDAGDGIRLVVKSKSHWVIVIALGCLFWELEFSAVGLAFQQSEALLAPASEV